MKNNRNNTIFLVLLNLSLIAGFSYIFFNGGLENVLTSKKNRFIPVTGYVISIDKSAPSSNKYPRQSSGGSKIRSSSDDNQEDNTIPTTSRESFYGKKSQSRKGTRGVSSYSGAKELMTTGDDQSSSSSSAGGSAIYAGSRKGGGGVSEGANYSGSMPFTDGISTLNRSSAPRGPGGTGGTILIDPQTDPQERKRIPVGEGFGIMLLFAAAFASRIYCKQ